MSFFLTSGMGRGFHYLSYLRRPFTPATEAEQVRPAMASNLHWRPVGCAAMLAAKMIWDFSRIDYIILRNFGKLQ
jgi:hypothetical protein